MKGIAVTAQPSGQPDAEKHGRSNDISEAALVTQIVQGYRSLLFT